MFLFCSTLGAQAQTKISYPEQKDLYSQNYYDVWVTSLESTERIIDNANTIWQHRAMEYFNRFLVYAKMQTNETRELLAVFMDAYNYEPHVFCHEYVTTFPLQGEEYQYLWEAYQYEKPIMDALCDCTLNYDKDLVSQLKSIEEKDQRHRGELTKGASLNELKNSGQWDKQLELDRENLEAIKSVVEKFGYPDRSLVGYENEAIAFLVIQHSNLETMEAYLPLIEESIRNKKLKAMYKAYLIDRIATIKNEDQVYGTQYTADGMLFPIKDLENVNKRRAAIGLGTIDISSLN